MKKLILFILAFTLLLPTGVLAAEKDIPIYLDGKHLQFTSKPFITEGATLVPLRTIFSELGADVSFNSKTQTVKATKGDVTIQLILEQDVAFRNGEPIKLSIKPRAISGVTFVPLRFISQSFGCTIEMIGKQINIYSPTGSKPPSNKPVAEQFVTDPTTHLSTEEIGKLSNRVVYIEVYDEFNQILGSGSGVVVGSDGNILTNYHVIDGATSARIDFTDQRSYSTSTLLLKDADRDLALLKIDASLLPAVSLGDSSTLNLGEEVVAIGSPLGFKNTLSSGVVSTTSRIVDGHSFIQISTPIDHGSSGGALFAMNGELIGITTALVESSAAINLAIPSNDVKTFLAQPHTPQSLSSSVSQETLRPQGASNPQQLQDYLNANYSGITYEGLVLHFTWTVYMSTDNQKYLIGGTMYDGIEWADWMSYQQIDNTTLATMILYMSEQLRESQGIENSFFTLYVNSYFSFYPSSFPSHSISSEYPGYRLNYNFVHGSMDYSSGYLYYNLTPENSNAMQWIRMK